ncbi:S49 family peptidase [Salegentibacter sp. BDJ18]|uniref:S49 family peptidase n=1 Tax=Salegentibacter sp. BDJ18 TaxID=2816376 RepID=UPI001AAFD5A1|nr:S49 family peptidase [Salegentibacter sp. BDJ18]MBO2546094.1 S49 family peptidase [Salegentibacter sp. BDJ18]
MKVNPILQDLYKGEWLIDTHSIISFAPIVSKIIAGEELVFGESSAALLDIYDKNSKKVLADEDGQVEIPKGSIAVVNMIGAVIKRGDLCTYGADEIVGALRFANNNPNIRGIVFNVDGPGGSVGAIGPFIQFAKEKKKPVVGLIDTAYSLHYWALVSVSDWILADNEVSSGVGSVGVVFSFVDTRKVLEEKGYVFHDIYPDESKHKNEAFHLAREGKYDQIKTEHLSPIARKFQNGVRFGRAGKLKEATGVLTGKTFDFDRGMEYGMLDGSGSFQDAVDRIDMMIELNNY